MVTPVVEAAKAVVEIRSWPRARLEAAKVVAVTLAAAVAVEPTLEVEPIRRLEQDKERVDLVMAMVQDKALVKD